MAGTFTVDLSKFAEKTGVNFDKVVKKVVFDLYVRIASRTPVDTGRARGGWQIGRSIGSGEPGALDNTPTGRENPGWGELGKVRSLDANAEVVAYIYNNVVYISVLEDGHSQQAPAGMVKVSLIEFEQFIAAAVASLG